jgi:hypothetical protein
VIGSYNTEQGTCEPCTNKPPSSQYTSNSNPYAPNACAWACVVGFYKGNNLCLPCSTQICAIGQYRSACQATADSSCTPCTNSKPSNSDYSASGEPAAANNCAWTCSRGYFSNGGACSQCSGSQCAIGQYRSACSTNADGKCLACTNPIPPNAAYSAPGSPFDSNSCAWACNAGYYKNGNACPACSTTGCPVGQYRGSCSPDKDGACLACTRKPASSSFVGAGSLYNADTCAWACVAGFYASASACVQCTTTVCPVGQYRIACAATADGRCAACTNPIPANAAYKSAGSPFDSNSCAWACNIGYFKNGNACQACSTTPCAAGQYRGRCAQDSDSACVACTVKPASSNFIGAGSPYNADTCAWACVAGFYNSASACVRCSTEQCAVGQYRTACTADANSRCAACTNPIPANAAYTSAGSPFDSNNCAWACNAGYFKDGNTCRACTRTQCAAGEYRLACTPDKDGTCAPCTNWQPEHAKFVAPGPYSENKCEWGCISGYYRDGSACRTCATGTCPIGQYRSACTGTDNAVCKSCTNLPPHGVYTGAGQPGQSGSCETSCAPGFVRLTAGSCVACDTSTCPTGQYRSACTVAADGKCGACTNAPANADYTGSGQPYGSNNCAWACRPGYYRSGQSCVACSTAACPVGQYRGACAATADGACQVCTTRPSNSIYTSAGTPYNTNACQWSCASGYFRADGTCKSCSTTDCPSGQYRGQCADTADRPCLACTKKPDNAVFSSAGSPYNADACAWKCGAGYYRSGGACAACTTTACPVGQYRGACGADRDGACTWCTTRPANSVYTTAGVPYGADACGWACSAGYYRASGACAACSSGGCPVGKYRAGCAQGATEDSLCVACTNLPANAVFTSAGTVRRAHARTRERPLARAQSRAERSDILPPGLAES